MTSLRQFKELKNLTHIFNLNIVNSIRNLILYILQIRLSFFVFSHYTVR